MRFSNNFNIHSSQEDLDFIDIPLEQDIQLFVDPYALSIIDSPWHRDATLTVQSFFDVFLECIRERNKGDAVELMKDLGEPNETRLGYSSGAPRGHGFGPVSSSKYVESLIGGTSEASRVLRDIEDMDLFVDRVGRDLISDMTTRIIRSSLMAYTYQICLDLGVETHEPEPFISWNPKNREWEKYYAQLPHFNGKPIVLVPKNIVRRIPTLYRDKYYNHVVITTFLEEEMNAQESLVKLLKKDIKAKNPFSKELLRGFHENHPDALDIYKDKLKEDFEPLSDDDIEKYQPKNE